MIDSLKCVIHFINLFIIVVSHLKVNMLSCEIQKNCEHNVDVVIYVKTLSWLHNFVIFSNSVIGSPNFFKVIL